MQALQRTLHSALGKAISCIRSSPSANMHAKRKALPLKNYLDFRVTQKFSLDAAIEHPLHEGLLIQLSTLRPVHSICNVAYYPLRAIFPPFPIVSSENSWIRKSIGTILQELCSTLQFRWAWPVSAELGATWSSSMCAPSGFLLKQEPFKSKNRHSMQVVWGWSGDGSHISQKIPQLAGQRVECRENN